MKKILNVSQTLGLKTFLITVKIHCFRIKHPITTPITKPLAWIVNKVNDLQMVVHTKLILLNKSIN